MELQENITTSFKSAVDIILGHPYPGEGIIFDEDRNKIDQYLKAVDEIQILMKSAFVSDSPSECERTTNVIQTAMIRLNFEFQQILTRHTNNDDAAYISSLSSSIHDEDYIYSVFFYTVCSTEVYDLRSIAERMNFEGYLVSCIEAYRISRKKFVDRSFLLLGLEKLSSNEIPRLEWEELQKNIKLWIRAADACVQFLFAKERELYEKIFDGLGDCAYDACFLETVKDAAIRLFKFAEGLASTRPSLQKLFGILELYRVLLLLLPEVNAIFHSKTAEFIRIQADGLVPRLVELIRDSLSDFENSLLHESSNAPVFRTTIHSLTTYVADYIDGIVRYRETLGKLIESKPSTSFGNFDQDVEFVEDEGRSPLALHLICIIMSLKFKLGRKSKQCKDVSLGHLFMMNNICYIVQIIDRSPELQEIIGGGCLNKLGDNLLQEAISYHRSTWDRVLYCLREDGLQYGVGSYKWVSRNVVKERFKTFNASFEEVLQTQSAWLVPINSKLRQELQQLILEELIPAYKSFLGKFKCYIESGKHPEKYIKYSVEELENAINDFFVEYQLSRTFM